MKNKGGTPLRAKGPETPPFATACDQRTGTKGGGREGYKKRKKAGCMYMIFAKESTANK